ncbi:MAG: UbiD family decarboxylase [Deltaproteobacteria bacterium]|nr:UbiD family decarboxylase [Deltaproteobacteria bacterium]MBI3077646.1 UbiD family decarboxylase [Deltaproteobacteria bacterium]
MPYADLREYLAALERQGELCRVTRQVSPEYELAGVCIKTIARRGPVLLFESVKGSSTPVLNNPFGTRRRVAVALECEERDLLRVWLDRMERRIEPVLVADGPCKEVRVRDVDLTTFPVPILWHEGDGGPYITFAQFICKDPDTGVRNVGIYRMEVKGPRRTGLLVKPPQHAGVCIEKAEARGEPLEFALAIGTEPCAYLCTQAPMGFDEDEYVLASSLRRAPLELVRCESVDLEVPAHAEIVIEGRVLPGAREDEGPFGEWTGYMSGRAPRPVVEITAMTHRRDPIYAVTYEGYPVWGPTNIMQAVAREPEWFKKIRSLTCPSVVDVHFTPGGCAGLHAIASIRKQVEGQGKNVLMDLLRTNQTKLAIVVDDDIDIRDPHMVEWAIATRFQADRDLIVVTDAAGMKLDPSQPSFPSGIGTKMGIDATLPLGRKGFPEQNRIPDAVMRQVEADWASYGVRLDER